METKVLTFAPVDGINAKSHRKENHFQEEFCIIAQVAGKFHTPVTLRTYGTKSMNYACLWINDDLHHIYCNGSGSAGGYGYHRTSAAAHYAINQAGIKLNQPIDGRGESAIKEALTAIAIKLGYRKNQIYLHSAHA